MEKRHRHHIHPRHLGGGDETENIELLDPVAHAELHAIRFLAGEDNWFDCRHEGWALLDKNLQEKVKQRFSELNSTRIGEKHPNFGKQIHSQAFRKQRSQDYCGSGNPMYGKERPDTRERLLKDNPAQRPEVREKIRQAALGRVVSEETRKKISEALKGKPKPRKKNVY